MYPRDPRPDSATGQGLHRCVPRKARPQERAFLRAVQRCLDENQGTVGPELLPARGRCGGGKGEKWLLSPQPCLPLLRLSIQGLATPPVPTANPSPPGAASLLPLPGLGLSQTLCSEAQGSLRDEPRLEPQPPVSTS